jgi:two-component system, NarL family, nitrate/nitrite response regulator NarL
MTGRRVVLADDLSSVLNAVARLLEGSFEIVGTAANGRLALEAVRAHDPDLLVLDISMPEMSGIEVARELKARRSRTKIVFLSVHEDTDILATCQEAGGLGYVVKVLMDTDLMPAMNAALAGRPFVSQFPSQRDVLNGA